MGSTLDMRARTAAAGVAALALAWMATAGSYRRAGKPESAVATALVVLGELLGLLVVCRPAGSAAFSDDEDGTLVEPAHGAQRHLVVLAVKLGLARQRLDSAPSVAAAQLEELRADVQATIATEALGTAVTRSPLSCAVEMDLLGGTPSTSFSPCVTGSRRSADRRTSSRCRAVG